MNAKNFYLQNFKFQSPILLGTTHFKLTKKLSTISIHVKILSVLFSRTKRTKNIIIKIYLHTFSNNLLQHILHQKKIAQFLKRLSIILTSLFFHLNNNTLPPLKNQSHY